MHIDYKSTLIMYIEIIAQVSATQVIYAKQTTHKGLAAPV